MQKAHRRFLMLKGAGFHNRAYKDFYQAASNRVNDYADYDARVCVGKKFRQKGKADQAQGGAKFGRYKAFSVADFVNDLRTNYVHHKLRHEKNGWNERDLRERDLVIFVEGQKQEGREVCANRLRDKAQITGQKGFVVFFVFLRHKASVMIIN